MNIGNEFYSGLSSLSRQSYLLFTEVPEMIIVFNINYQLQYNPSYTGTIHGTCEVQYFNYYMSFVNAMQAVLRRNYNSFLLTIFFWQCFGFWRWDLCHFLQNPLYSSVFWEQRNHFRKATISLRTQQSFSQHSNLSQNTTIFLSTISEKSLRV